MSTRALLLVVGLAVGIAACSGSSGKGGAGGGGGSKGTGGMSGGTGGATGSGGSKGTGGMGGGTGGATGSGGSKGTGGMSGGTGGGAAGAAGGVAGSGGTGGVAGSDGGSAGAGGATMDGAAADLATDARTNDGGAAGLSGSTVTATLYNPNLQTVLGGPAIAVVGASNPTFPNGTVLGNTSFEINITSNQITYNPLANVTYGNGAFNGFVFVFANAPTILGVTLDAASNFNPTNISFTGNSVSMNLSANTVTTSSVAILDLQLAP